MAWIDSENPDDFFEEEKGVSEMSTDDALSKTIDLSQNLKVETEVKEKKTNLSKSNAE